MKQINITFNIDQYKALLKLIYLGEWMINSHLNRSDDTLTIEEEVEQLVYAAHSDPSLCEFEKDLNMYFPSKEFEEKMQPFIDEYDDFNFWEDLAYKLADRDTTIELGEKIHSMETKEIIRIHHKYLESYSEEFMLNHLNNLKIK